ncbi:MAG: hypothetical protein AB8I08_40020 [Sandaracinaceae bacterium]
MNHHAEASDTPRVRPPGRRRGLMRRAAFVLTLLLVAPAGAFAQTDAVSFGDSVEVPSGQTVESATSFGGDTIVSGTVRGDAVSFGGDVVVRPGGQVEGTVTSFGGAIVDQRSQFARPTPPATPYEVTPAAAPTPPEGPLAGFVHWVKETARSLLAHVMIFLLGLLMIGVTRERLRALQTTMIRDSAKTAGWGFLGYLGAGIGAVILVCTIIGIPVAAALALALPVATYVGLAAAATVIGAALPVPQLQGREIPQLAAGVGVLFVASLVPVAGFVATALAACLGFGALLRTRLSEDLPGDLPPEVGSGSLSPEGA